MREHLRSYLHFLTLEKNAAANTVASYTFDLSRYLRFLEEEGVREIGRVREPDVEKFVARLRKNGLSPRSISRNLSAVKMFHKFLTGGKGSPRGPAWMIDPRNLSRTLPDLLNPREVDASLKEPPAREEPARL